MNGDDFMYSYLISAGKTPISQKVIFESTNTSREEAEFGNYKKTLKSYLHNFILKSI